MISHLTGRTLVKLPLTERAEGVGCVLVPSLGVLSVPGMHATYRATSLVQELGRVAAVVGTREGCTHDSEASVGVGDLGHVNCPPWVRPSSHSPVRIARGIFR